MHADQKSNFQQFYTTTTKEFDKLTIVVHVVPALGRKKDW